MLLLKSTKVGKAKEPRRDQTRRLRPRPLSTSMRFQERLGIRSYRPHLTGEAVLAGAKKHQSFRQTPQPPALVQARGR